jgi:hypothetical protein
LSSIARNIARAQAPGKTKEVASHALTDLEPEELEAAAEPEAAAADASSHVQAQAACDPPCTADGQSAEAAIKPARAAARLLRGLRGAADRLRPRAAVEHARGAARLVRGIPDAVGRARGRALHRPVHGAARLLRGLAGAVGHSARPRARCLAAAGLGVARLLLRR